jgi:hypothetical protein
VSVLAFNPSGLVFGLLLAPIYRVLKGVLVCSFLSCALRAPIDPGWQGSLATVYIGFWLAGMGMTSYQGNGPT